MNFMEYKKISINGVSYGDNTELTKEEVDSRTKVTNVDFRDRQFFQELENPGSYNYENLM